MTCRPKSLMSVAAVALLTAAAAAAGAATPTTYQCVYLTGTGEGDSDYPEGQAINELGTVAGVARYHAGELEEVDKATVWVPGQEPLELPTHDLPFHEVSDVNNAGWVVGAEILRSYLDPIPMIWRNGQAEVLPIPPGSWAGMGRALAVNDTGDIVGVTSSIDTRNMHATLWRKGKVFDLGTLGGHHGQALRVSQALGVNDAGVVVGWSEVKKSSRGGQHAVRWDNPWTLVDLGGLPDGGGSKATAISNRGTIVGSGSFTKDNGQDSFMAVAWNAEGIHGLGLLKGHKGSVALKVNDDDVIVGASELSDYQSWRAMVWFGVTGAPRDLNNLVGNIGCKDPTGAGFVLERARDINKQGVILATGVTPDGTRHATFELVPQ
ncbi:hypothetical protein AACH06_19980 [Ideonella sp. DXS29W]|uniref:HAF repeat-containing protein n=1 Tax=Ideonella lacteola TaxID=2984193 RepID=A0ABU9BWZ1_9BURK